MPPHPLPAPGADFIFPKFCQAALESLQRAFGPPEISLKLSHELSKNWAAKKKALYLSIQLW
jgi:hypothetical protein